MRILFVFTGGTIGSTLNGDVISADASKPYKIIEAYQKRHGISFDYDTVEPYTELSENNTGLNIKKLVACVKEKLGKGYDGIIVTHGTDTLQFSAAAVGYSVGLDTIPICLVSANAPIEDAESNALDNLHGAIRFIESSTGRGAFVVYRNKNSDTVRVHRATRLIGAKAYSDDASSVFGTVYGYFDSDYNFIKNQSYNEILDEIAPLDASAIGETNREALLISPYPGMIYPRIDEGVRYIILNSYHSGTINTKSTQAREFFKKARERNIPVFVTGVTEGPQYSSASCYEELGIVPIINMSPVAAYVKLWLLSAADLSLCDMIKASLSGDLAIN